MSRQGLNKRAAVIAQARKIMESPFGIVTDFHGAKLVILCIDFEISLILIQQESHSI